MIKESVVVKADPGFDGRTDCNKANGLFIGHLEDVKVDWATLKDDVQGMPSFAGMISLTLDNLPAITFASVICITCPPDYIII